MDAPTVLYREKTAAHLIKVFERRRFEASYAATAAQAKQEILAMIPSPCTVFRCGSESIGQLGLWAGIGALPGVTLIDPYLPELTPEQGVALRRSGLSADVMLASSNAVTMDGRLVNLDGVGNRVAAMIFGPKKVILLVGMNKVASDLDCAMARIRQVAAPANNLRLKAFNPKHDTPCLADGRCHVCASEDKICNAWTIIEGSRVKGRIHVKLCGEDLGY
ncbi:MAG: lactate utilization protein [Desulfovibrionaceae bacterium]|nr:lactate utilization protein [Desulfovibrionaceae bacterium]MBF0515075.1 lactate utilization protein [Desulfovibrionaceae bacterium]